MSIFVTFVMATVLAQGPDTPGTHRRKPRPAAPATAAPSEAPLEAPLSGPAEAAAPPPAEPPAEPTLAEPTLAEPAAPQEPAVEAPAGVEEPLPLKFRPRLVPSGRPPAAALAAQLLADAMQIAPESGIEGQPITLERALAQTSDARARGEIIHAYWKLALVMADVNYCWREQQYLHALAGPEVEPRRGAHDANAAAPSDAGGEFAADRAPAGLDQSPAPPLEARAVHELEAVRSALAARLAESQISLTVAQQELGALLRLGPTDRPPLAADLPHAGAYRTEFERLFAGRSAPAHAWLLVRMLPVRQRELEARAGAVQAADDALVAAQEEHQRGTAEMTVVLEAQRFLAAQRRALLAATRQYNDEIADYALTAAPLVRGSLPLTAMLIKPRGRGAGQGASSAAQNQGEPAGGALPGPAIGGSESQAAFEQPLSPVDSGPIDELDSGAERPPIGEQTLPVEAQGAPDAAFPADQTIAPESSAASRELFHDTRLYGGLAEVDRLRQAPRLAALLHWDRSRGNQSPPLGLAACLERARAQHAAQGSERATALINAISLYWNAREQAARYQVLDEVASQLDSLAPLATSGNRNTQRISDGLVWRAARAGANANRLSAEAAQLAAQWQLSAALGAPLDRAWLLPSTAPHAGRYRLKPTSEAATNRAGRVGEQLAQLHELLLRKSAAVIDGDAARSAAIRDYAAGEVELAIVLRAVGDETGETLEFLNTVTRYNQVIAEYALAILPADAPSATLERMLVVEQPAKPG